ncbi:nucleoside triphosphate pyrophosphohydrolase family protein [Oceanimonas pelagia]|uniref:Nucleoside triphosphate pyrophosphohydrolase family protein n=1 Tax=Oceanimonas pelagia TaxID=3028314 RepID=A0AA50KL63_9GAMM|nr:nucleoside triphosphate pyrophosphohydrolase family protein [Oceanimonas pelagia]WMC09569.1 nucleoside triphosphate pyrophosphohydrolase family protein [Oceanimonas pelagia]
MIDDRLYATMYADVLEFRRAFDLSLELPTDSDATLHDRLRLEEFEEAVLADTQVDRLDALVDSAYVTLGDCVQRGLLSLAELKQKAPELCFYLSLIVRTAERLGFDFAGAWAAVHKANMDKLVDEAQVWAVQAHYQARGIMVEFTPTDITGKYIAKAANDTDEVKKGKLLKPANFQAPNLMEFIG